MLVSADYIPGKPVTHICIDSCLLRAGLRGIRETPAFMFYEALGVIRGGGGGGRLCEAAGECGGGCGCGCGCG